MKKGRICVKDSLNMIREVKNDKSTYYHKVTSVKRKLGLPSKWTSYLQPHFEITLQQNSTRCL